MKTKAELQKTRGTPNEFEATCVYAVDLGLCTYKEASAAAEKYRRKYKEAPNEPKSRFWVITFEDGTVYRCYEHITNVRFAIDQAVMNCRGQSVWGVVKAEANESFI